MTLPDMSNRKRSAARRILIRAVSAVFGICVVAAVIVTDNGIRPGNSAALIADFSELQVSAKAAIGIALAPVGGSGTPLTLGNWHSGPAWSTIKVPLVMAALRGEQRPYVTEQMTAAITQSDNAAAEAIWVGLGDPATAARKVEAVLAEAGDLTRVQSQRGSITRNSRWSRPDPRSTTCHVLLRSAGDMPSPARPRADTRANLPTRHRPRLRQQPSPRSVSAHTNPATGSPQRRQSLQQRPS